MFIKTTAKKPSLYPSSLFKNHFIFQLCLQVNLLKCVVLLDSLKPSIDFLTQSNLVSSPIILSNHGFQNTNYLCVSKLKGTFLSWNLSSKIQCWLFSFAGKTPHSLLLWHCVFLFFLFLISLFLFLYLPINNCVPMAMDMGLLFFSFYILFLIIWNYSIVLNAIILW